MPNSNNTEASTSANNQELNQEFLFACRDGKLDKAVELLKTNLIDINCSGILAAPPLAMACICGKIEIVEMLLNHSDIDVNKVSSNGCTPLYFACSHGHIEIVKMLLSHPYIDVNLADFFGTTPLSIACFNEHEEIIELLLNHHGIDVNYGGILGASPLLQSCFNFTHNNMNCSIILAFLLHRTLIIPSSLDDAIEECFNAILQTTLESTDDNLKKCAVLLYLRGFKPENPDENDLYKKWGKYNDNKNQNYHELHQKDLIAITNPVASLKELSIFAANKLKNIPQWYSPLLLKLPTSSLAGMLDDFIESGGIKPDNITSKDTNEPANPDEETQIPAPSL